MTGVLNKSETFETGEIEMLYSKRRKSHGNNLERGMLVSPFSAHHSQHDWSVYNTYKYTAILYEWLHFSSLLLLLFVYRNSINYALEIEFDIR